MHISIGIRTAPRDPPTLGQTVAGLRGAGFHQKDVHVFYDYRMPSPTVQAASIVHMPEEVRGNWPALRRSLEWLTWNATADWYLMLEDDVLLSQGLCNLLSEHDSIRLVNFEGAWLSLYASSLHDVMDEMTDDGHGERPDGFRPQNHSVGSLAYLVPAKVAERFVADADFERDRLWRADEAVGLWCQENGVDYYEHCPSLALHIGMTGAIQDRPITAGRQCKRWVYSCDPWMVLDIEQLSSSHLGPAAMDVGAAHDRVAVQVYGPDGELKQQSASLEDL